MTIGGKDVHAAKTFPSINPYTVKPWAEIPEAGKKEVDQAVKAAKEAFPEWASLSPTKRGALLRNLAALISDHIIELAEIETRDNGKLLAEMKAQVTYVPEIFTYFAGLADKIEGAVPSLDKPDIHGFTTYEPLGVCAAITAWNSPLMLAAWKLAPALAAGNTAVIKPSEHASASTLAFAKLFAKAGFPPGVVNAISGFGPDAGAPLISHPDVAKVSFTGGSASAKTLYPEAAKSLKHVSLELGGKSPNIVFADADIDNAVKGVISGIFAASGQTCIAGSRCLVQKEIHDTFVEKLVAHAKIATMGDPMLPETNVGPIATEPERDKVLDYIAIAKNEGAEVALGGKAGEGWFVEPTIFTHVTNDMRIAQAEVFGPILVIIPFSDEEEALHIANDTPYGLAAGLWTSDARRMLELPKKLQAGTIWVNTYRAISMMMPFGGYKQSGIGRENGQCAIYEYLQCKSTWISTSPNTPDPFKMKI